MPTPSLGLRRESSPGPGLEGRCLQDFLSVPGCLQTVERTEDLVVILALRALVPVNLGIDDMNVCDSVGRLLSVWRASLFRLSTDGDLLV